MLITNCISKLMLLVMMRNDSKVIFNLNPARICELCSIMTAKIAGRIFKKADGIKPTFLIGYIPMTFNRY